MYTKSNRGNVFHGEFIFLSEFANVEFLDFSRVASRRYSRYSDTLYPEAKFRSSSPVKLTFMTVSAWIFIVFSIAKAGLMHVHQTSFDAIRELVLPSSQSHMSLLKQADQAMLTIRSEFPGD